MKDQTVRIAGIVNDSIVDGPGLRLAVFTQGCTHNCKGCHNRHTHDLDGGRLINTEEIIGMIDRNILLDGITFSGGEPFLQAKKLAHIAEHAKNKRLSVIAYTGYEWEDLINGGDDYLSLIKQCDYIIDGKYDDNLRSLDLLFKGSSNQRIIDVKRSLESGEIYIVESFW